jgi:DNA polymerase-3 subunit gamma/tau
MSRAFYRKYRPQKFSEFIGQEHITKTLTNAIASGMISHAYLFYGPKGSGKTTLARLFAKSINCQNRKEGGFEPCCKCTSCIEIQEGRSMDLIEIDAASHRGIDEVRELRDGIRFVPSKSKYKVYIIDEAHQLTKEAANALLKTLEEPPAHTIFILATTEVHKMIPTILSRCQRFDFRRLTKKEILKKLQFIVEKEKIKIEKEALEILAQKAEGSLRDAESLLDQVFTLFGEKEIKAQDVKNLLGLVESEIVFTFFNLIAERKQKEAIEFLNSIYERGVDLQEFTKDLISLLRDVLIFKIGGKSLISESRGGEEINKIENASKKISEESLRKMIVVFLEAQNKMKFSPILQLPLELAVVEVVEWLSGRVIK